MKHKRKLSVYSRVFLHHINIHIYIILVSVGAGTSEPHTSPNSSPTNSFMDMLDAQKRKKNSSAVLDFMPPTPPDLRAKAMIEVAEYLSEPSIKAKNDPYKYWNENKTKYPTIASLVRRYHSAPAGSIESERLFSKAKLIVTDLRKRISVDNLSRQLFLHENLPLINFNYTF
jgi:hypothetical protein